MPATPAPRISGGQASATRSGSRQRLSQARVFQHNPPRPRHSGAAARTPNPAIADNGVDRTLTPNMGSRSHS